MDSLGITSSYPLDHELLEAQATKEICACLVNAIADNLDITTDQELTEVSDSISSPRRSTTVEPKYILE